MTSPPKQSCSLEDATIGIVTALPKERAAVRLVFGCDQARPVAAPRSRMRASYDVTRLESITGGTHVIAISSLVDMGNNFSAAGTNQLLADCPNVGLVLMVGIAGAIPSPTEPEHHVRLGDIVVSSASGVVQFDIGKRNSITDFKYRGTETRPAAALLNCVRNLQAEAELGRYPWERYIADAALKNSRFQRPDEATDILVDGVNPIPHPNDAEWRRKGQPRVFLGPIGSSNILLKDANYREKLRIEHGVKAIEMEAAGLADATWLESCGYLIVRGTCDYCNHAKSDIWQRYAANVAAGFARSVIEYLPAVANPVAAPPFVPSSVDVTMGRMAADIAHIRSQLQGSSPNGPVFDPHLLEEAVRQLMRGVTEAWRKLEGVEAITVASKLEELVNKHESVLSFKLLREVFATLANSAINEAQRIDAQNPDMSKALRFIERGRHARR